MSDDDIQVHLHISGSVQGIYYRVTAADEARRLGLVGWVRNLPDGRVEAVAEGRRRQIDRFVEWCRRGPPAAVVTGVETKITAASGGFDAFDIQG